MRYLSIGGAFVVMDYLYVVKTLLGSDYSALAYPNQYKEFQPDPFLWLSRYALDTYGSVSQHVRDYEQSTSRTIVKERPSFLDSLGFFFEVLEGQSAPRSEVLPGWNPRDRAQVTGVLVPGYFVQPHRLGEMYAGGVVSLDGRPFVDLSADVYIHAVSGARLVFADQVFDLARRIHKELEGNLAFKWWVPVTNNAGYPGGGWPGTGFTMTNFMVDLNLTSFNEDSFSYDIKIRSDACWGQSFGGPFGSILNSRTSYKVTVKREKQAPWNYTLKTTLGHGNSYFDDAPYQWWGYAWQPIITLRSKSIKVLTVKGHFSYNRALDNLPVSIMRSVPALYHTQSRALTSLLTEVSRNFESLIESPELLPLLLKATTQGLGDELIEKLSKAGGPFGRAAFLIKLLCGAYLGFIFAVNPALKSAWDVLQGFWSQTKRVKGKSYMPFNGTDETFGTLPEGLQGFLTAMWPEEVRRYEILFGSHIMLGGISASKTASVISSILADAARHGVEPDPAYIYASVPFTFVFDWAVPMGALISDAYQRFRLITRRGLTVGHTVSLTVTYASGLKIRMFIRSDATLLYLDPPDDSWLQATGVPAGVAIPLAAVMLL